MQLEVVVVGAGVAGLACAAALGRAGARVVVVDKARGAGGRVSTRRGAFGDATGFDHGAQFFTVRDADFGALAEGWRAAGLVAEWRARFGRFVGRFVAETPPLPRWVGVPGMSAVTKALAAGLDVRTGVRVSGIRPAAGRWVVDAEGGEVGRFDRVVVAVPAPQAVVLLDAVPALAAQAAAAKMSATWAVMLRFEERVPVAFDAVDVRESPISWAAREGSKPGRAAGERWVVHSTGDWAGAHLEDEAASVAKALSAAFEGLWPGQAPVEAVAHRWRFALVREAVGPAAHWDAAGVGACGDWCVGPRVEAAWQSGVAMAAAVLGAG